MKQILIAILVFVFSSFNLLANEVDIDEIRTEFYQVLFNKDKTPVLLDKLYKVENPDGIIMGYTAATEALMAKYVWNPYNKFKYLYKSKKTFNNAIRLNESNPEIRFLRFSVQYHLPKYLGLSKDLKTDKQKIITGLPQSDFMMLNTEMVNYIMEFMIKSNECTREEIEQIRKTISNTY